MSSHHHENDDQKNARRLYNPYQDLNLRHQTLYNLPTSPEYLFPEEANVRVRPWNENLTLYTGCGVLSGAMFGAGEGLIKGVKSFEAGDTKKLKASRILNSSGDIGRRYANRAGVIGLLFASFESLIISKREKDNALSTLGAGFLTGAVFKIGGGPKPMMIAGAIGGVMGGFYAAGKHVFKRYVPT